MTRLQHLRSSWQYDHTRARWTGFDGVEHWTVEEEVGTSRWLVGHSGRQLTFPLMRKFTETHRTRWFRTAEAARWAAEQEAERLHQQDIARRRNAAK